MAMLVNLTTLFIALSYIALPRQTGPSSTL